MTLLRGVDAVLFDLDGTLVEGRDSIWDAFAHALDARGHARPERAAVERMIGRPLDAMFRAVVPACTDAEAVALNAAYVARFRERAGALVRLAPGAREALDALRHLPLAVVTTKSRAPAEWVLDALAIRARFATLVAREDAPHVKPHPAPVLEACCRLGVAPARALMVGDTDADVRAALAAGARVAAVLHGHGTEAELRAAGARDLLPDLFPLVRTKGL